MFFEDLREYLETLKKLDEEPGSGERSQKVDVMDGVSGKDDNDSDQKNYDALGN